VESARLIKEKTMAILVKDVTDMIMAGARVSTVRRNNISKDMATSLGSSASSRVIPILGMGTLSCPWASDRGKAIRHRIKSREINTPRTIFFSFLFISPSQCTPYKKFISYNISYIYFKKNNLF
jgi:hypothetical protein